MNYGAIKKTDIANGPGVRVSLFVSGCRNHCPGCFQPETWDFGYGEPFTEEIENEIGNGSRGDKDAVLIEMGIKKLIEDSLVELTDNAYFPKNDSNFFSKDTGAIYDVNQTVRDTDLKNGSRIILL